MDTQEQAGRYRILNRDAIKYIAMFTMLLNHIAQIFMAPGAFWTLVLTDVGYFTAPVMCWFLVEGYGYTRSKKRYGLRLAAFAALSELPFCLAFTHGAVLSYYGMNMIFTLLLCFLILVADEKIRSVPLRRLAKVGLTLLTVILPSDWNLLAPVYTMLFAWARGSRTRAKWAFFWAVVLFWGLLWMGGLALPAWYNLVTSLGGAAGVALAAVVILYLYNGRRAAHGRRFAQWFFYWFYPVHLLVLGLLRVALM